MLDPWIIEELRRQEEKARQEAEARQRLYIETNIPQRKPEMGDKTPVQPDRGVTIKDIRDDGEPKDESGWGGTVIQMR